MESAIVRKLCHLHVRQLRHTCQSWSQLRILSQQSTKLVYYRMYCTDPGKGPKEGGARKLSPDIKQSPEPPFISPIGKPKQQDFLQELHLERRRQDRRDAGGPNMVVILAIAVGFLTLYIYMKQRLRQHEISEVKKAMGSSSQDDALVGGEWELTNHDGKKTTDKDYLGQWCLIYFGFTHCPDVCPDELEKITDVMEILDRNQKLPKLKALFITVDPERDSPEAMKDYLSEFSDKIVGLTGNWDELKKILRAFKVYYSKGPVDEDGDYIVDHSIITYLMNPDGKYEAHFARSKTNIDVATAVESKMNTWVYKPR